MSPLTPEELPDGFMVKPAQTLEEIEGAKDVEYETFLGQGYIGTNAHNRVQEYKILDPCSDFYVVKAPNGGVVAEIRRVKFNPSIGFLTTKEFEVEPYWKQIINRTIEESPEQIEEMVSIGVLDQYRAVGRFAFILSAFRLSWQDSVKKGVKYWIYTGDKTAFRLLKQIFHFPMVQIGPVKYYLGSDTVPGVLDIQDLLNKWRTGYHPTLGEYFLKGL